MIWNSLAAGRARDPPQRAALVPDDPRRRHRRQRRHRHGDARRRRHAVGEGPDLEPGHQPAAGPARAAPRPGARRRPGAELQARRRRGHRSGRSAAIAVASRRRQASAPPWSTGRELVRRASRAATADVLHRRGNWTLASGRFFTDAEERARQGGLRDRRRPCARSSSARRTRSATEIRVKRLRLRGDRPARGEGPGRDGHRPGRHDRHAAAHRASGASPGTTTSRRMQVAVKRRAPRSSEATAASDGPAARAPQHRRERRGQLLRSSTRSRSPTRCPARSAS